jgi:hypothetical protein
MKHKVSFCWECGRKLWGNHKVICLIGEEKRTIHKTCAKQLMHECILKPEDILEVCPIGTTLEK